MATTIIKYTLSGEFEPFQPQEGVIYSAFEKEVDIACYMGDVEYTIASMLMKSPHKNIVTVNSIINIVNDIHVISFEFLDLHKEKDATVIEAMTAALHHLHGHGVVYVDLHIHNIGWSYKDNCWKLFDFNMCGILKTEYKWYKKPIKGFMLTSYKKLKYEKGTRTLFDIDMFALAQLEASL